MSCVFLKIDEVLSESLEIQTCRASLLPNGSTCILRQVKPSLANEHALLKLQEEYSRLVKLRHEGLAKVVAANLCLPDAWVALEDQGYEQLSRYYLKGALRPFEAVKVAISLLEVIAYLHANGIILQTLNPSDILFNRVSGKVQLVCLENRLPLTEEYYEESNQSVFNDLLLYLDPILIVQPTGQADVRSDLYTLGVIMYEMVLFRSLFGYSTYKEIISAHLVEKPHYTKEELQELPMPLLNFINKLLAKTPRQRFDNAAEALKELYKLSKLKVLIER